MKKQLSENIRLMLKGEDSIIGSFMYGMLTPTNYLDFFEPFQEFLVASAEEVLKQGKYAAWHLKESTANHRMIIMDSLPITSNEAIEEAAITIAAALVVGPMYAGNPLRSVRETIQMAEDLGPEIGVLGSVYGTVDEGVESFKRYVDSNIKTIGFNGAMTDRLSLIRRLADIHLLENKDNYVLGGVSDLTELQRISALGDWVWLLYSNAPMHLALLNQDILNRVHSLPDIDTIDLSESFIMDEKELYKVTANLVKFRTLLPQTDDDQEEDD